MGVERFRSIEEMNAAPVRDRPGDAFERFVRHCARFRMMAPRKYPRGVFRYRSVEEAQAARVSGSEGSDERRVRGSEGSDELPVRGSEGADEPR